MSGAGSVARRVWHVALLVLMAVGAGLRPARAEPSFAEIVTQLAAINGGLHTFVVDQMVDVRVLRIFHWGLRTTVYAARPANYKIVIHNLPPALRSVGNVFADISSPEDILRKYRATSIRSAGSSLVVELAGADALVNPPAGKVTIDATRWVIEELSLNYEWGDVRAKYKYGTVDQFLLPISAQAWVPRFAVSADITYANYQLNVPIPPATFDKAGGPGSP